MLGWTIGNDMSERTWQRGDRTLWRAKNTDTFKPMGPWIETDFDLDAAMTIVRVNGEVTDHFRTNHMIYGVANFISRMSQYLTLYPGDVVWMGTEGVAAQPEARRCLRDRDHRHRHLRNPLVRERAFPSFRACREITAGWIRGAPDDRSAMNLRSYRQGRDRHRLLARHRPRDRRDLRRGRRQAS